MIRLLSFMVIASTFAIFVTTSEELAYSAPGDPPPCIGCSCKSVSAVQSAETGTQHWEWKVVQPDKTIKVYAQAYDSIATGDINTCEKGSATPDYFTQIYVWSGAKTQPAC